MDSTHAAAFRRLQDRLAVPGAGTRGLPVQRLSRGERRQTAGTRPGPRRVLRERPISRRRSARRGDAQPAGDRLPAEHPRPGGGDGPLLSPRDRGARLPGLVPLRLRLEGEHGGGDRPLDPDWRRPPRDVVRRRRGDRTPDDPGRPVAGRSDGARQRLQGTGQRLRAEPAGAPPRTPTPDSDSRGRLGTRELRRPRRRLRLRHPASGGPREARRRRRSGIHASASTQPELERLAGGDRPRQPGSRFVLLHAMFGSAELRARTQFVEGPQAGPRPLRPPRPHDHPHLRYFDFGGGVPGRTTLDDGFDYDRFARLLLRKDARRSVPATARDHRR